VRRRHVIDELRFEIAEAEGETAAVLDALEQQVEVTVPRRNQPRAARSPKRPFDKGRGTRAAESCTNTGARPVALAHRQVDLRAQPPAETLRVAAGSERETGHRVAVDHGDGTAVGHAVDGVHQISSGEAIDDEPGVLEAEPAHGEFAIEIVRRTGGRQ